MILHCLEPDFVGMLYSYVCGIFIVYGNWIELDFVMYMGLLQKSNPCYLEDLFVLGHVCLSLQKHMSTTKSDDLSKNRNIFFGIFNISYLYTLLLRLYKIKVFAKSETHTSIATV